MSKKDEYVKSQLATAGEKKSKLLIEEFEIIELEDRLELADRCNRNCECPGGS